MNYVKGCAVTPRTAPPPPPPPPPPRTVYRRIISPPWANYCSHIPGHLLGCSCNTYRLYPWPAGYKTRYIPRERSVLEWSRGQSPRHFQGGTKALTSPKGCNGSYRISANRCHGVYLFPWSVWCGHYSRAAFIRGRRLLLSAV